eukprot:272502_1
MMTAPKKLRRNSNRSASPNVCVLLSSPERSPKCSKSRSASPENLDDPNESTENPEDIKQRDEMRKTQSELLRKMLERKRERPEKQNIFEYGRKTAPTIEDMLGSSDDDQENTSRINSRPSPAASSSSVPSAKRRKSADEADSAPVGELCDTVENGGQQQEQSQESLDYFYDEDDLELSNVPQQSSKELELLNSIRAKDEAIRSMVNDLDDSDSDVVEIQPVQPDDSEEQLGDVPGSENIPADQEALPTESDTIVLKFVTNLDEIKEIKVYRHKTSFRKVHDSLLGVFDKQSLVLKVDGESIDLDKFPVDYDLEDGDQVDVTLL